MTTKTSNINIGCEDCERTIPAGEQWIEVNECEKICFQCGMRRRNEWVSFFANQKTHEVYKGEKREFFCPCGLPEPGGISENG